MKKIKFLLVTLGLVLTLILTACGDNSQPLEGTWQTVNFFIDENQEINYIGSEITFTTSQLTHEDHVATWEISEDGNFLLIDSGHFFGSQNFELAGDNLYLADTMFFRTGSRAYEDERERVEYEANTLLTQLIGLETALDDFDTALLEAEERIEQEVLAWLEGSWTHEQTLPGGDYNWGAEALIGELTVTSGQFTYSVEFTAESFELPHGGSVDHQEGELRIDVHLHTNVDQPQIDAIQQSFLPESNDIEDAIEELRMAINILENLTAMDITRESSHSLYITLGSSWTQIRDNVIYSDASINIGGDSIYIDNRLFDRQ